MPKIIEHNGDKYWINGDDQMVLERYVPADDKSRDKLVGELIKRAKRLNKLIAGEKEGMSRAIADYLNKVAAAKGEEWSGGTTLYNFAADQAVVIKVARRIVFSEKLNLAKQKIDECIREWSTGATDELKTLVGRAFEMDKQGKYDTKQILGLRQMKFDHPLWTEAMELIVDSIIVQGTKTYFYFQQANEEGALESIVLDYAKL